MNYLNCKVLPHELPLILRKMLLFLVVFLSFCVLASLRENLNFSARQAEVCIVFRPRL